MGPDKGKGYSMQDLIIRVEQSGCIEIGKCLIIHYLI